MSPPLRIMSVAALCATLLVALVINEGMARRGGQEVRLAMEAVDPRALLSGHYVDINLTERLEPGQICPANVESERWVVLRRQGGEGAYRLVGSASSRDQAEVLGPLPIRGVFTCSPPFEIPDAEPAPGWVRLDIGISRFHINQRDALRIEQVLREQSPGDAVRAFAIVSVGRDGRARLKGIEIDGERLDLSWL
ncbi:MAG TPA: GDYXXLXY domain-containing protein [Verrucomicrobiae bacterium]|nr:GDYXXLXY domain-containing protein [Verrucomicrobiae bacterium]